MNYSKIKQHVNEHIDVYTIILLLFCCVFLFFVNIGRYALMDVDETRYVAMAKEMFLTKDFLTLKLDEQFFFEKPPLYFWGECLSFWIFGHINEITARIPVALYGTLSTFLVYFIGKRLVSRNYGLLAALILATSIEFNILSKFAILDIVVTACIGFSVLFGFMTFFCNEKNKKYFWWLFYAFSGLAVMAKGIPGFVIPFGTMFFASIAAKKFKEIFRLQYIIPGVILFLLIVLPWHIIMLKMHGQLFWDEYFVKHHFNRFFNSKEIGREEPFYFYIITFIWGFIPWTFFAIPAVFVKIKEWVQNKFANPFKHMLAFNEMTNPQKFMYLNVIGFLFTFLFFSTSSTKLITYILPVYFFSACIMAFVIIDYINKGTYKKAIHLSVYIVGTILLVASIVAMFAPIYLPEQLYADILHTKWLCIGGLIILGIWSILAAIKDKRLLVVMSYIIFIGYISAFLTEDFFEIDYKFGQNDLIYYANLATEHNRELVSFGFGKRYSLLYHYGTDIEFETKFDYEHLDEELHKENAYVVIRNKDMEKISQFADFYVINKGRKYSLIEGKKGGY